MYLSIEKISYFNDGFVVIASAILMTWTRSPLACVTFKYVKCSEVCGECCHITLEFAIAEHTVTVSLFHFISLFLFCSFQKKKQTALAKASSIQKDFQNLDVVLGSDATLTTKVFFSMLLFFVYKRHFFIVKVLSAEPKYNRVWSHPQDQADIDIGWYWCIFTWYIRVRNVHWLAVYCFGWVPPLGWQHRQAWKKGGVRGGCLSLRWGAGFWEGPS